MKLVQWPHVSAVTRRSLLGAFTAGAAGVGLAACGGGPPAQPAKKLQGMVEFWTNAGLPYKDKVGAKLADAFTAKHPDVRINWTDVPADTAKLIAAAVAGTPPDIAYSDRYYANPEAKDYILPQVGQDRTGNLSKTPAEIERTKALYYGYVTFVDKWIGVLLEKLDELRLRDDTVVMFLSDHGTELMDNGVFSKNLHGPRNYNQQINWLVRLPGQAPPYAGAHVEPYVMSHDVPATILDLLDVAPPEAGGLSRRAAALHLWPPAGHAQRDDPGPPPGDPPPVGYSHLIKRNEAPSLVQSQSSRTPIACSGWA